MSPLHKLLLWIEALFRFHPTTEEHQEAEKQVENLKASHLTDAEGRQAANLVALAKASHPVIPTVKEAPAAPPTAPPVSPVPTGTTQSETLGNGGGSPAGIIPFAPAPASVVEPPAVPVAPTEPPPLPVCPYPTGSQEASDWAAGVAAAEAGQNVSPDSSAAALAGFNAVKPS